MTYDDVVNSSCQGKVQRSVRRPVAGVCLLLAAKFILDLKKQEISDLIDVSCCIFHTTSHTCLTIKMGITYSESVSGCGYCILHVMWVLGECPT